VLFVLAFSTLPFSTPPAEWSASLLRVGSPAPRLNLLVWFPCLNRLISLRYRICLCRFFSSSSYDTSMTGLFFPSSYRNKKHEILMTEGSTLLDSTGRMRCEFLWVLVLFVLCPSSYDPSMTGLFLPAPHDWLWKLSKESVLLEATGRIVCRLTASRFFCSFILISLSCISRVDFLVLWASSYVRRHDGSTLPRTLPSLCASSANAPPLVLFVSVSSNSLFGPPGSQTDVSYF
jgi:hypothetical protein